MDSRQLQSWSTRLRFLASLGIVSFKASAFQKLFDRILLLVLKLLAVKYGFVLWTIES